MYDPLRRLAIYGLFAAALVALPTVAAQEVPPFERAAPPGPPPAVPAGGDEESPRAEEPEILGRGPVHEGFAQPGEAPRPGPVAPKAPPEPVPEQPPEERPEGDNVEWLPGYWSWDEDRRDFVWISGFWRLMPRGRKWVPGYWSKADEGWQWVSGFWARADQSTLPYLPEAPPDSLDRGPNLPPPDDSHFYVPGNWLVQESRFVWQPGYWCRPRVGLVWSPSRWCWTPRGYLFVSGFWDACLEDRGILFAPVFFPRPFWNRPGWAFRPVYAVPPRALVGSLWVRPRFGQYAFGDFYGNRYAKLGYQPWALYGPRSRDPLFAAYRASSRTWQRDLQANYLARAGGDAPLPPRTLRAQQALGGRGQQLASNLEMIRPLTRFQSDNLRMTTASTSERASRERYLESMRQAGSERRSQETRASKPGSQSGGLALDRIPAPIEKAVPRSAPREVPRITTTPRAEPLPKLTPSPWQSPDLPRPPRLEVPPTTMPRNPTPSPKSTRPLDPGPKLTPAPRSLPRIETPSTPAPPRVPSIPAPKLTMPSNPTPPPTPRMAPAPTQTPRLSPAPSRPSPPSMRSPAPPRGGSSGKPPKGK